ncbi:hypothetical protein HZB03_03550 [Candidatus Woesearchaeota archaeon]|nr:hypothetical protein [Candidatus Woesearchaeota archaeon]
MAEPKVLIGCPVSDRYRYCIDRYLRAVNNLDYKNFDLLLVDNSADDVFFNELRARGVSIERIGYAETARERIVRSRNILRERALAGNYDYFLSLEIDLFIPKDTLKRLLSHHKPIVTAYYGNNVLVNLESKKTGRTEERAINVPLIYLAAESGKVKRANPKDVLNKGLIEIGAMGLGCALIAKEALETITFHYDPNKKACDDMYFCTDAKKAGYKLYLDSSIIVPHEHQDWEGIKR